MASNMFVVPQTRDTALCCKCGGIVMGPNPGKACSKCLVSELQITKGLRSHVTIMHCPDCDCYLQPPRTWIKARYGSKKLLAFCVKHLETDLKSFRLVKAEFVGTKQIHRGIFVKLKVQKKIIGGLIIPLPYYVEFVQQDHKCESCTSLKLGEDGMRE